MKGVSLVKRVVTHEYKDGADEVTQDAELEE